MEIVIKKKVALATREIQLVKFQWELVDSGRLSWIMNTGHLRLFMLDMSEYEYQVANHYYYCY